MPLAKRLYNSVSSGAPWYNCQCLLKLKSVSFDTKLNISPCENYPSCPCTFSHLMSGLGLRWVQLRRLGCGWAHRRRAIMVLRRWPLTSSTLMKRRVWCCWEVAFNRPAVNKESLLGCGICLMIFLVVYARACALVIGMWIVHTKDIVRRIETLQSRMEHI